MSEDSYHEQLSLERRRRRELRRAGHEHDIAGCLEDGCGCVAGPPNSIPCTCPSTADRIRAMHEQAAARPDTSCPSCGHDIDRHGWSGCHDRATIKAPRKLGALEQQLIPGAVCSCSSRPSEILRARLVGVVDRERARRTIPGDTSGTFRWATDQEER